VTGAEEIVDALEGVSGGPHRGFRAAHARGVFCRGTFTATPEARELSRAEHLQGEPVSAAVRFSNGSGDPGAPDTDRRDGRGMATKFQLRHGGETDIVAITIPVFFVRTARDFLDFLHARKPDPETGEMDMEKVGAFIAAHPETQAALQLILPTFVPPASYATCAYNSLHAFGFTNAAGETRFGRYRWEPEAEEQVLSDEEIAASPPNYLAQELADRLSTSPVGFILRVTLAEDSRAGTVAADRARRRGRERRRDRGLRPHPGDRRDRMLRRRDPRDPPARVLGVGRAPRRSGHRGSHALALRTVQASDSNPPEFTRDLIDAGTVAIRVEGEVDLSSVDALSAEVERAIDGESPQLVLDLGRCDFVDSSVLALLVDLRKRLNSAARARFAVVADGQPLQVIKTTQLDREIPVFSTASDAVAAVSG